MLVAQARAGAQAAAPLLDHDAALLVDLGGRQQHAAAEIGERLQALLDDPLAVGRHLEHVDRLVGVGVRVQVGADLAPVDSAWR